MDRNQQVGTTATVIGTDHSLIQNMTYVQYHNTKVVKWSHLQIVLDSGGWRTATTKLRMNQASNQFGLGFQVYQRNHAWFVDFNGQTLPFEDGIVLAR